MAMTAKFECTKYQPDMTYGDWSKFFINDLTILKKAWVWMEAEAPPAVPDKLPNATSAARVAAVCRNNAERCALIHVIGRMPIAYRGKDERVERVLRSNVLLHELFACSRAGRGRRTFHLLLRRYTGNKT